MKQQILNLCRVAVMHLNQCNLPPYSLKKTKQGNTVICSGGGSYMLRIWENGICDEENGKFIEHAMNNNFRFAAALAIAVEKLDAAGITDLEDIHKCFQNDINFKQLDKFES